MAVVLEGGYSLEALEVSSEAVFKVLQAHPKDEEAFNEVLQYYDVQDELNTYEKLAQNAMLYPRYSFKLMISNIAKLIKKQWASVVEDLIFDKPRRKSSAQSKQSGSESKGSVSIGGDGTRNRLNSMEDSVIEKEMLTFGTQKSPGIKPKRSTTPTQ